MAPDEKQKWDSKHAVEDEAAQPAEFLQRIFQTDAWGLRPGRALDIATGKGRNALFLVEKGFTVDAVDLSRLALAEARRRAAERSLTLNLIQADMESFRLPDSAYDLILNINFLLRSLVATMKHALRAGGYIVFDTYLIHQQALGHPRNPAYLLQENELLNLFRDFRVLSYQEGKFSDGGKASFRAQLLGQKPLGA